MSDFNLEGIIKVIAVGIPALLILLGFFAFSGGIPLEIFSGNDELKNTGLLLLASGICFYIIELVAYLYLNLTDR